MGSLPPSEQKGVGTMPTNVVGIPRQDGTGYPLAWFVLCFGVAILTCAAIWILSTI